MLDLNAPVTAIDGVGEKKAKKYEKLGVETIGDLLESYPNRYDRYPRVERTGWAPLGRAAVAAVSNGDFRDGANGTVRLWVDDGSGRLGLSWFSNPWVKRMIRTGEEYVFLGDVTEWNGVRFMNQPTFMTREEYSKLEGSLKPVYPLTAGLTNDERFKDVMKALSVLEPGDLPEDVPVDALARNRLMGRFDATRCAHWPASDAIAVEARKRIAFGEFYLLLKRVKESGRDRGANAFVMHDDGIVDAIRGSLPYPLTGSQEKAVADLLSDFAGKTAANRVIQGDVGCGKTLVAIIASCVAAENGFQSAVMAPTSVLAKQHYESFCETVKAIGKWDEFAPVLLVGSLKESEKRKVKKAVAEGKSLIVIGTQAVIQESVEFRNLALTIADEQHRFGVEQRGELAKRQKDRPHGVLMTATPIPRTTAQLLFGGMDLTVMKDKPANRLPVITKALMKERRREMEDLVRREIAAGRQAYFICPMVEGDAYGKKSVEAYAKEFAAEFPGIPFGTLHGKMKDAAKAEAMDAFSRNETKALISTTVVEVGVNVPNASVIVIEDAEGFGLLQLHQLRGRVGRGSAQSYCELMNGKVEPNGKLDAMVATNDGFEIAEADYRMRKAGALFGTKQSGDMGFKIGDVVRDEWLLRVADEEAKAEVEREAALRTRN